MISRAAENCYWLARHIERIESTVKFLQVNQEFVLDTNPSEINAWFPFISVSGEESHFCKKWNGTECYNAEIIQNYLCWDLDNPHSILSALTNARENCRTIRDIISTEMWECINSFWLWLQNNKSKQLYHTDRHEFYQRIKYNCELFQGLYESTLLREEPYYFIKLGLMLERVSQTARIIDIKHHRKSSNYHSERETIGETIDWLTTLKYCSASEAYLKKSHFNITRQLVANFLIFEEKFPRTILYCLTRLKSYLTRLANTFSINDANSLRITKVLLKQIKSSSIEEIIKHGLHEELTYLINKTAEISEAIQNDLFSPQLSSGYILGEQAQ